MPLLTILLLASTLVYQAPEGWKAAASTSRMRLAQWELPGDGADSAEVVIFFFGEGGGGGVEANLERWFSQFEQPDGSSTRDGATITEKNQGDLRLTIADMRGTFVAPVRPGVEERNHRREHRMIAAVIEGGGGPWYFRALGPEATIETWAPSIEAFFDSMSVATTMED